MDIYEQHQAAFARVSAYVILRDGERVATVALKYPADGAGRPYAYVHWIGLPMVRGFATGGGYDKATAACASAVTRFGRQGEFWPGFARFAAASRETDTGFRWDDALRSAGFTVLQAV